MPREPCPSTKLRCALGPGRSSPAPARPRPTFHQRAQGTPGFLSPQSHRATSAPPGTTVQHLYKRGPPSLGECRGPQKRSMGRGMERVTVIARLISCGVL